MTSRMEGLFLMQHTWHSLFYALAYCLPFLQLGHIIGLYSEGKSSSNRKMWHLWLFLYMHGLFFHRWSKFGLFDASVFLLSISLLSFRCLWTLYLVVWVSSLSFCAPLEKKSLCKISCWWLRHEQVIFPPSLPHFSFRRNPSWHGNNAGT